MQQNIPWGSQLLRLLEECKVVQHVPGGQIETNNHCVSFGILFLNPDHFCNVEDQSQGSYKVGNHCYLQLQPLHQILFM